MEFIKHRGQHAASIAASLKHDFALIDVGCSGGIDPVWREFAERLSAIGFDPNVEEIARLKKAERASKIKYETAFVGVPDDHPITLRRGGRDPIECNPGTRLAVCRTQRITSVQIAEASNDEKTRLLNAWKQIELTKAPAIFLPEYFEKYGLSQIDFLKIDIDGNDFDVLQSIGPDLAKREILGVCAEVNFFGSGDPTEHSFHNVDQFMRAHGFDLFALSTRTYSAAALPFQYRYSFPAQSIGGRPLQGDAIYLRDLCSPYHAEFAAKVDSDKLLKLSALFSLCGLPDCAAEVLLKFQDRVDDCLDVAIALDLLSAEIQNDPNKPPNYKNYMAAFENNDPSFYNGG